MTTRALALAALLASVPAGADEFGSLTVEQMAARLKRKDVFVFDTNPYGMWQKAHVPGAKWILYDQVRPEILPADHAATLVFYCANEH